MKYKGAHFLYRLLKHLKIHLLRDLPIDHNTYPVRTRIMLTGSKILKTLVFDNGLQLIGFHHKFFNFEYLTGCFSSRSKVINHIFQSHICWKFALVLQRKGKVKQMCDWNM